METIFKQKEIYEIGGRDEEKIKVYKFNEFAKKNVAEFRGIATMSADDLESLTNDGEQIEYFIKKCYTNISNNLVDILLNCRVNFMLNEELANIMSVGVKLGRIEDLGEKLLDIIISNFCYSHTEESKLDAQKIYKVLEKLNSVVFEIAYSTAELTETLGLTSIYSDIIAFIETQYNKMVSKVNYHINSMNEIIEKWTQKLNKRKIDLF